MEYGRRLAVPKPIVSDRPGVTINRVVGPRPPIILAGPKQPREQEVGVCLVCDDVFTGPEAVRLVHGQVYYHGNEPQFRNLDYPDHTKVKWLCPPCAEEHTILAEGLFEISYRIEAMQKGWCCLCRKEVEPAEQRDWSSAIRLEIGCMEQSTKGNFLQFVPRSQEGHFHWFCMEDLELYLQQWIPDDDAPPTEEDMAYQCE